MRVLGWLLFMGVGIALSATHLGYLVPVVAVGAVLFFRHQVKVRDRVIAAQRVEIEARLPADAAPLVEALLDRIDAQSRNIAERDLLLEMLRRASGAEAEIGRVPPRVQAHRIQ